MAELRHALLEAYCALIKEHVPAGSLRVHAKIASGSSILLLDGQPLTRTILEATSFYVHAARVDSAAGAGPIEGIAARKSKLQQASGQPLRKGR